MLEVNYVVTNFGVLVIFKDIHLACNFNFVQNFSNFYYFYIYVLFS